MALMRHPAATRTGSRGCCSIEDASDARRAAARLGIDFYVWDLSADFEDLVVSDFLNQYSIGRTPNPCVRCNEFIKFQVLAERAQALGFDGIVTGHYARLEITQDGQVVLCRALDMAKDQSYVLASAGPEALRCCLFPLGEVGSKAQVRAEAEALGLPQADKPDSYDICFVADGKTGGFLRERLGVKPGPVVDQSGVVVGHHEGAYQFTIGQRRGLRLGRPASDGRPRYVTGLDMANRVVRVGPAQALMTTAFAGREPVWLDAAASAQAAAADGLTCAVQVRAHGVAVDCLVRAEPGGLEVHLEQPLRALASGQAAVFYQADRVLGSATIEH
jgi:tRNA-specific 2-thiouridylase